MDRITRQLIDTGPDDRVAQHFCKARSLLHMDGITLPAHVALEQPNIVKSSDNAVLRFSGNHQRIGMNEYRILLLKADGQSPLGDEYRIPVPVDFGIVSFDH